MTLMQVHLNQVEEREESPTIVNDSTLLKAQKAIAFEVHFFFCVTLFASKIVGIDPPPNPGGRETFESRSDFHFATASKVFGLVTS